LQDRTDTMASNPESLSFRSNLKCEVCEENVNYGEDYECHLKFEHGSKPQFIRNAMNRAKNQAVKSDTPQTIVTLDDDSDDDEEEKQTKAKTSTQTGNSKPVDAEKVKQKVKTAIDTLFKEIRECVEGKKDDNLNDGPSMSVEEMAAMDKKIWDSFEEIKIKVKNITVDDVKNRNEKVASKNTSTVAALTPPAAELSEKVEPKVIASKNLNLTKKASADPKFNSPSDKAKPKLKCPVAGCKYIADKSDAAHLTKVHKLTAAEISKNKNNFKFKKIFIGN